jgi:hypothetical protein
LPPPRLTCPEPLELVLPLELPPELLVPLELPFELPPELLLLEPELLFVTVKLTEVAAELPAAFEQDKV